MNDGLHYLQERNGEVSAGGNGVGAGAEGGQSRGELRARLPQVSIHRRQHHQAARQVLLCSVIDLQQIFVIYYFIICLNKSLRCFNAIWEAAMQSYVSR